MIGGETGIMYMKFKTANLAQLGNEIRRKCKMSGNAREGVKGLTEIIQIKFTTNSR